MCQILSEFLVLVGTSSTYENLMELQEGKIISVILCKKCFRSMERYNRRLLRSDKKR